MKSEKTKTKEAESKKSSVFNVESHSYNNPDDLDEIMSEDVEILKLAKEKIKQQAAYLDIVEEGGSRFAIVKNSLDNTVMLKTENPNAIEFLFEEAD